MAPIFLTTLTSLYSWIYKYSPSSRSLFPYSAENFLSSFKSYAMAANSLAAVYRWAVPLALGVSLAQASIYDVKGGTRAVIFDRLAGVKDQVVNEGTHFLIPWLQKAVVYDVRTKPRNISTTTGSKDLQMVSLTLRVLHRPEVKMLPKIYQVCILCLTSFLPTWNGFLNFFLRERIPHLLEAGRSLVLQNVGFTMTYTFALVTTTV